MKQAKRLFLTGSVQGMFFRQFIKDNAGKIGVNGFVRNLEDGRVEVFIEGNVDNVAQMDALCRRGSPHSHIRKVEEKEEHFQDFKEFRIVKI